VTKRYPGAVTAALLPTSLDIVRGEFFSVLGPSGSGKTTALRMIAGFEMPDSGRVILDGQDVTHVPPFKRDVSTVFQSYALFPHKTVAGNVGFPLEMANTPKSQIAPRVGEALSMVEMGAYGARYPHQLSGGQRQRIALARALVGKPKLLLLDEPLGALDLRLRQQMQHVLVQLQRELGITFVYVTHDQSEALSMSNRVAIVDGGRIRQLGTPQEIYFAPKDEFVAKFIGKSNLLDVTCEGPAGSRTASLGAARFAVPDSAGVGKARLSLRFESVDVVPAGSSLSKPLQIEGTVTDALFLGSVIEVKVHTAVGEILAHVAASRAMSLQPGAAVTIGMDPKDGALFGDAK
jgi:spermidine/putrescine transport system ATP-binding protein